MIDDLRRIIQSGALRVGPTMRLIQIIIRHRLECRQPATDKSVVGIETLSLRGGVENAEIGRGIGAGGGRPLPAAVIGRPIAIDKLRHEIALAPAPIDKQIFDQKTGGDHSQPIVHPTGLPQLSHGGIDNGIAGATRTPGVEQVIILPPGDVARPGNKRLMATAGQATSRWR